MSLSAAFQRKKVTPFLVHKDYEDDVLICNERGALPCSLKTERLLAASLSAEELAIIRRFYWPAEDWPAFFRPTGDAGMLYLCCVPPRIDTGLAEVAEQGALAPLLAAHYAASAEGYTLNAAYLDECEQIALMNGVLPRKHQLNDFDRLLLSSALDRLSGIAHPRQLYLNMVMDTRNYFFYRKHHEHVPGMMLLEVARQAMYAFFYRFSQLQRGQVSLSISRLDVSFQAFVDANYPVRLLVQEQGSGIGKSEVHLAATLYQRNQPVAVVTLSANIIGMKLFRRLRLVKPLESSRFLPEKNISPSIIFRTRTGESHDGRLLDLSAGGLCAVFAADTRIATGDQLSCVLFVEGEGMVEMTVRVAWCHDYPKGLRAGFVIQQLTPEMRRRLLEAIKNFTILNTRREVL